MYGLFDRYLDIVLIMIITNLGAQPTRKHRRETSSPVTNQRCVSFAAIAVRCKQAVTSHK
jgi:hypothetical protein